MGWGSWWKIIILCVFTRKSVFRGGETHGKLIYMGELPKKETICRFNRGGLGKKESNALYVDSNY